jgi:hypothetical protein
MPLALSQFGPMPMNRDFTPSSNYAVNEAKNSALLADAARKKEATQRLSGRMPDVQKAIQNHDIMNQGVQDLMEVNPELYKTMAAAVKLQDEVAKSRAEKTANFMAGVVPYVLGAKERGVPEAQAWEDYKGFGLQGGVPLGQFENMPYSENALALLKSSVYGIKGVLEGGATIKQEGGALVTRTPLGDVKDVKVLPQEKADKAVPVLDAKGRPVTVQVPGTNDVKIKMSDGTLMAGGSIPKPEKPEKPDTLKPSQKIQYEGQLRDDYRNDSKTFVEIQRQAKIIGESLNDPSAAGTLAAATSFMKMLDPGSVVRESELGMAMQSTGALDRFMNYTNVIQSGKVLTAQQKQDFGRLANQYLTAATDAQAKLNERYTAIANEYGINPKNIVMYDVGQSAKRPERPQASKSRIGIPPKNAQGWVLHTDAKGNRAYVSPDGKQYQKVK